MQPVKTIVVAIISGVALVATASAEISRGCKAQWEVRYARTEVNGRLQNPIIQNFGRFDSRGRCRSRIYANDCRRAARNYAQACFRDHWERRWEEPVRRGERKPPQCVGGRSGVGVMNYNLSDLKQQIERQACSLMISRPFRVHVVGRTWGDERCGGEEVVSRRYVITEEMCGKI